MDTGDDCKSGTPHSPHGQAVFITTTHNYAVNPIQWNLSIVDATGLRKCVLIREASLFQRLICTHKGTYTIGTSETVLITGVLLQLK